MPKLPRITSKQLVACLKRLGLTEFRQRGSHLTLVHQGHKTICTIPLHSGETMAPKTLKSILDQASVTVQQLNDNL